MDHIVYLDHKARELEKLLQGTKTMIIRGATGRKLPYGRVFAGDTLYFVTNNGDGKVRAYARVVSVFNSEMLAPDASQACIEQHQPQLQLNAEQMRRWAGKRYLVLIEVANVVLIEPFAFDRSGYGNMDDWLPVGAIDSVRL